MQGAMRTRNVQSRQCSAASMQGVRPLPVRRSMQRVLATAAGSPPKPKGPQQMLVYVPPHPLVKHWLAILRSDYTPSPMFRSAAAELGRILLYECMRDFLPTIEQMVQTPLGDAADATLVDPTRPIKVVPILRAGMIMLEQSQTVMPFQETYHVGYVRDPTTLEAKSYLNKLPAKLTAEDLIVIADPMLATGGTITKVVNDIVARGASAANIRVVAIVAAPPALKALSECAPGLKVYTAMIDESVDEKGYIHPGLGDAGDRAYGTAHA